MICYICGKEGTLEQHINDHPKQKAVFKMWGKNWWEIPEYATEYDIKVKTQVSKMMQKNIFNNIDIPQQHFNQIPYEKISYSNDTSGYIVGIYSIDTKDIIWDARTRYMCKYCNRYGKSLFCPPRMGNVEYYRKNITAKKSLLLVVAQGCNDMYLGRTLIGMANKLKYIVFKALWNIATNNDIIMPPSWCHRCKPCRAVVKGEPCRRPKNEYPSPEALGMALYSMMSLLGIPIQTTVFDYVTVIGGIATNDGINIAEK